MIEIFQEILAFYERNRKTRNGEFTGLKTKLILSLVKARLKRELDEDEERKALKFIEWLNEEC